MGKKKRAQYVYDHIDTREPYTAIYKSMLFSSAWKSLTKSQRYLYTICKYHVFNTTYRPEEPGLNKLHFYFNQKVWKDLYGLYTNNRTFYTDMQALIDYGFVKKVSAGKCSRSKNVYRLSDEWKEKTDILAMAKLP